MLALTHRSFAHEAGGIPTNERLEFLGDSVLGLVVTEALYRRHPDLREGELAKMRAATVSQRALAGDRPGASVSAATSCSARARSPPAAADKDSILSDTLEALFGAVYLAHGLETARALVERLVGPTLAAAADLGAGLDWKTSCRSSRPSSTSARPITPSTGEGPDHARTFTARVLLTGEVRGEGTGTSKKIAEQTAAAAAYSALRDLAPA